MEMQDLVSPPDRGNDPDSQAALAEAWGPGAKRLVFMHNEKGTEELDGSTNQQVHVLGICIGSIPGW